MVNINKLKGKIVEKGISVGKLAKLINIDTSTMYRKINSSGETFTIKEASLIAKILELNIGEVNSIFFSQYVA